VIKLDGTAHRQFTFPDEVTRAAAYYRDFDAILPLLPHITLVQKYSPNQFRALYHTVELGLYRVKIYCDIQVRFEEAAQTLRVAPLAGRQPIRQSVSVQSLAAQGYFTSRSIFIGRGDSTAIDYQLELHARLPKPFGLSLIPDAVMNQIANSIAKWRIEEIATGFIQRSIQAYRAGQAVKRTETIAGQRVWCPAALPLRAAPDRPARRTD
jgi:hypothetical protein